MKPALASGEKDNTDCKPSSYWNKKKWQRRAPGTTVSNQKETSLWTLQEEEENATHKYSENVYANKLISLMEFIMPKEDTNY